MGLAILDDHRSLADVVQSFAASRDLRRTTRGALDSAPSGPDATWKEMCDLGWAGLHLPEDVGGSGYGLPELAVVAEQLGAVAAPGPFLAAVIGSAVLDAITTSAPQGQQGPEPREPREPQEPRRVRESLLPSLADGSSIAVVDLRGSLVPDDSGKVTGRGGPVPGGAWADHVLARVGDDLVLIPTDAPGVTVEALPGLDPSLGGGRLTCTSVAVTVFPGAAATAVRIARALAAAEAAGGARATAEMALEYAKVREQFGRIIGSFQAIKHHLANMLVETERATAAAWDAARAAGPAATSTHGQRGDRAETARQDLDQAELASAAAVAVALAAYQRNAQLNIQVLGGIGFTWEHDAHLYLRRAATLIAAYGPVEQAEDDVQALSARGVRRRYAVDLPPEAETYREQARAFADAYRAAPEADRRRIAVEAGYLVPHWPAPWGRGAGPVEQLVLDEELTDLRLPSLGIGGWVLLTLTQHGSAEQIERWIAPSLLGDLVWCQLFSEPGAGSDAAAVQTRAVRVDGGWRITGQKVWTSDAHLCNRGLATVRTDPSAAKHKGITAVVVDLRAEGVEVRPLREITGEALFNEVFFDDVFIPDADVVGAVNTGWTVARATLGNERVSIGGMVNEQASAISLLRLLDTYTPTDAAFHRAVGRLIADEQTTRLINLRLVARAVAGAGPGAEGNVTKLLGMEHGQRVSELALRIAGAAAIDGSEPVVDYRYLISRSGTIAGGTSEIGRNVIAERLLGLPRDPLNR